MEIIPSDEQPSSPAQLASTRSLWPKRILQLLAQSALGLVFLYLWARGFPLQQLASKAMPHVLWPIAAIFILLSFSGLLRSFRWRVLVGAFEIPIYRIYLANAGAGLINYLIPIRIGDGVRAIWVSRVHRIKPGAALASVVADKIFDLLAITIALWIAAGIFFFRNGEAFNVNSLPLAIAAVIALGLFIILAGGTILAPILVRTRLTPPQIRHYLEEHTHSFQENARAAVQARTASRALMLSLLALLSDSTAFFCLFQSLSIRVSFLASTAAYAALSLAYTIPSAPGYVGTIELVGSLLVSGMGITNQAAAGSILLWHAVSAILTLLAGIFGLWFLRRDWQLNKKIG